MRFFLPCDDKTDLSQKFLLITCTYGGISFIRITDNGSGISKDDIPMAFLRHSTSKIKSIEDLMNVSSLGFRGEALSSIAAVAQVELITKTYEELTGTRYVIEGSKEVENEEIGAPEGTTFIVRNLFYNVPARRKFLKTAQTEAGYISDLMERMALSHPDVSFKFINNGQTKLHTSGNGNEKDLIYHIYGRDITAAVLKVEHETELFKLRGFIGKPIISRGNRNYENYFINGRYIKSALIAKSIEEAYKGFMMQHQYPFCVLYFEMNSELLDVNVHPTKMELRFSQNEEIYRSLFEIIRDTIHAGAPFKSIILRYFNPIGAHPSAEIGELPNGVPQNLIPYLTQTAMGIRKELSVFGDDYDTADGSCIRDYINVVDLAKAHVIAMDRMLENKSDEHIEIFNLGTGNGVSVLELINTFEQTTGVKVPHKIVGRREGDIEKVWANPEHANKVLGWTAKETLADTLQSAWNWQKRLRERGIQ